MIREDIEEYVANGVHQMPKQCGNKIISKISMGMCFSGTLVEISKATFQLYNTSPESMNNEYKWQKKMWC